MRLWPCFFVWYIFFLSCTYTFLLERKVAIWMSCCKLCFILLLWYFYFCSSCSPFQRYINRNLRSWLKMKSRHFIYKHFLSWKLDGRHLSTFLLHERLGDCVGEYMCMRLDSLHFFSFSSLFSGNSWLIEVLPLQQQPPSFHESWTRDPAPQGWMCLRLTLPWGHFW